MWIIGLSRVIKPEITTNILVDSEVLLIITTKGFNIYITPRISGGQERTDG